MKKYILTESQIKKVIDNLINEQDLEYKRNYIMAIQKFLNWKFKINLVVDGKTGIGSETERAIMRYQSLIGAQNDGIWGEQTISRMPLRDKQKFNEFL